MIEIKDNQVYSTAGKTIHRIGSDVYFKKCTILATDTTGDYEEVDAVPQFSKKDYENRVARLVRERYSESEEFALQRKAINASFSDQKGKELEEYSVYNDYVEACKRRAKEQTIGLVSTD